MELADVLDSKSSGSDTVRVRPPLPAPRPDTARYVSYRAGVRFFFCFRQENAPCCCRAETTDTAHPCTDARTGGVAIFGGDTASRAVGGSGRGLSPALTARPCLPCNLLPPIPPTPFPGGEGGDFSLFCRGLRPRHPYICAERSTAHRKVCSAPKFTPEAERVFVAFLGTGDAAPCNPAPVPGRHRRAGRFLPERKEPVPAAAYRLPTVRGNSAVSRMLPMPVTYMTMRSKPSPNPLCGTVPKRRVSRYCR